MKLRERELVLSVGSCAMAYDEVSHAKNGGEFINRKDRKAFNSRNWKMLAVKLGLLGKDGNCWS